MIDRSLTYGKSGIYKIYSKNKVYIGSASCLYKRLNSHKRALILNKHYNRILQNYYNKYGNKSLEFEVLEFCDKEDLLARESFYINAFNSIKKGFNILPAFRNSGIILTKEHRKNISIGLKKVTNKNLPTLLESLKTARESLKLKKANGTYKPTICRKGVAVSEDIRDKMRNAKIGKKRNWSTQTKESYALNAKLSRQGEHSHLCKLTEELVREIKFTETNATEIAIKFNISKWTVFDIRSGRSWSHIRPS